ncbi:MAG: PLP-dependent aminotransferase family protein [Desulfobacteraceae bacterium]|jgi:DNA-binding transcriptional MocR family regulator
MTAKTTRYAQVAHRIMHQIENGVFKEGDRIPSLRQLSDELNVSINTVKEAYWKLETDNYITAVPQSGFYVRKPSAFSTDAEPIDPRQLDPQEVSLCQIFGAFQNLGRCPPETGLAIADLDPAFWPTDKLNRYLQDAIRHQQFESMTYLMTPGYRLLCEQIAHQGFACGMDLSPNEIIVTNGCHEALFLAFMGVCEPGDTVVLESPVYFNLLDLLQQLKLKVIEIPSTDADGINLDTLRFVLENHPVKAMFSISNFNNPMGFTIPSWKKKELVRLLAKYRIPLIEDDIYGDLCFHERPEPCKAYDTDGEVMLCSSFSKTIAPGLRIGWIVPGKHYDRIVKLKTLLNISTASINQIAVARFLKEGGYKQHLRRIRKKHQRQVTELRAAVLKYFPPGTQVTRPDGGFVLWIKLPQEVDTHRVYQQAIHSNIMIAPGALFSIKDTYRNYMRLSAGTWKPDMEKAIAHLGRLCAMDCI